MKKPEIKELLADLSLEEQAAIILAFKQWMVFRRFYEAAGLEMETLRYDGGFPTEPLH